MPPTWSPKIPSRLHIWRSIWQSLIFREGPASLVPLRTVRTALQELVFQARLDQLAHPGSRGGIRDDLSDALRSRPRTWKLPPELNLVISHLNETKAAMGCSSWRVIEAAGILALERIGFGEAEARIVELSELLLNDASRDPWSAVEVNSSSLIVDLLAAGYSPEFVNALPTCLMDGYTRVGNVVMTRFPVRLYGNEERTAEARAKFIENLTWNARLSAIQILLSLPETSLRVTFQVRGLTVSDPLSFGSVVIYDPFTTPRLTYSGPAAREHFGLRDNAETHYPNIETSVQGRMIDSDAVALAARFVASRHLDLFALHLATDSPLDIDDTSYVISDADGVVQSEKSGIPTDDPWRRYLHGPNLCDDGSQSTVGTLLRKSQFLFEADGDLRIKSKLLYAIAAARRASDAKSPQDALLGQWTALEALIDAHSWRVEGSAKDAAVVALAERLLPPLYFLGWERFRVGWQLHSELRWLHRNQRTKLPADLAIEAYLEPQIGAKMELARVIAALPALRIAVAELDDLSVPYLLLRIDEVQRIYHSPDVALAYVDRFVHHVTADIRLAYRHRNRIVHDACDVSLFVQPIAERLGGWVHSFLVFAIENANASSEKFRANLSRLEVTFSALREDLSSGRAVNLLGDIWRPLQ